ncbi:ATP-dependent RNA helicase dbp2 [Sphagnurus paluster]|uniref:ATP-dependent RNA helicase dbp2 n=1 Tax=Sphagnurus paluster TaxID=117069 RepID=A0A9P7FSU9_9AGAR|nr:ATP-dependent RNA helicase dbp2 [Sphagnurus paluster]
MAYRAGSKGTSYTYFTTDNAKSARELVGILREAKAVIPPQLEEMTMYGGGGGGRGMSFQLFILFVV